MVAELFHRLDALGASDGEEREFDGLGYRSVSADFQEQGKPVRVSASGGVDTLDRSGQKRRYRDAGGQFEAWLVSTGANRLPPDIYKYVEGEIAARSK
ncbi:MAG: hypothetical protein ACLPGW_00020 [Roseiarcus sp.]